MITILPELYHCVGKSRAWDVLGAHHFHFQDLLKPLHDVEKGRPGRARTILTHRHDEDVPPGGDF